jgi:transposase
MMRDLVPDNHVLARVEQVLDLSWLRTEMRDCYAADDTGRPAIDPEAAVRLMLAGFLLGIVHDRRLLREAQVNLAILWFAFRELASSNGGCATRLCLIAYEGDVQRRDSRARWQ